MTEILTSRVIRASGLHAQRGVALITVMLVMVIAVAAVTHAVTRNRIAISRTSAILANTQLAEFVTGAEVWATIALENDFLEDKKLAGSSDSSAEAWAKQLDFNPDNGKMLIKIKDLNSCFNVNNLTLAGASATAEATAFRQLVTKLGGKPEVALAIQDWLDPGDTPLASDTEDNGYLGMEAAHRTPDTLISDISELQMVQGMDADEWTQLEPYICALPEAGTPINVNFASQELLSAYYPAADIASLINQREGGTVFSEYAQLASFGIAGGGAGLSFDSEYFVANIAVQLGIEHRQYWESILKLDQTSGQVRVLQRQRREFTDLTL